MATKPIQNEVLGKTLITYKEPQPIKEPQDTPLQSGEPSQNFMGLHAVLQQLINIQNNLHHIRSNILDYLSI